jgi:hypothetical protein
VTIINVDSVATDQDLIDEMGGSEKLVSTLRTQAARDGYRANAWSDVVGALATRSPPVRESDLVDPTELKMAVVYRVLSKACFQAATSAKEEDVFHARALRYANEYKAAVARNVTVSPGVTSPSGNTFSWERR